EAGGLVTDFRGRKSSIFDDNVIASNGRIHRQIQKVLLRQR
ncbi:MAG: inositol monophosphatase, partial [candidate division Zixibacteria bacterium]|nr:inositol monophosphatase [candidate division Zixibacteria bacterium]